MDSLRVVSSPRVVEFRGSPDRKNGVGKNDGSVGRCRLPGVHRVVSRIPNELMGIVHYCRLRNIHTVTMRRISADGSIGIQIRIDICRCEYSCCMVGHCELRWVLFPFCRTVGIVAVESYW